MAEIRFQVLINGQPTCVAGVGKFTILHASLSYFKRNPDRYDEQKAQAPADWSTTLEEWSQESIGINVRSSTENVGHLWLDRELAIGDEITIRILGPGEIDEPQVRESN